MERVLTKRSSMEKVFDDICPRIRLKLDKEKDKLRNFFPITPGNRMIWIPISTMFILFLG